MLDIIKTAGSLVGGIAGNAILPGVGGLIGKEVGSRLAPALFENFTQDPMRALLLPRSGVSKFVDNTLKEFGADANFRQLVKIAGFPEVAIFDHLKNGHKCECKCVHPDNGVSQKEQLKTNGNNMVDTGRYLITASENEVKIFDKQTNTWVKAFGDPHLHTSDGDKAQFHKNTVTINLPDGTKVSIKPTAPNAQGVSLIEKAVVTRGDEAVVFAGISDGQAGVTMDNYEKGGRLIDAANPDGTVMFAGNQVDDLRFRDGYEIKGGNPNERWGEHNLDKLGLIHNGKLDLPKVNDFLRDIIGRLPIRPQPRPTPGPVSGGGVPGGPTGTSGQSPSQSASGGSLASRLFAILDKLQSQLEGKLDELDKAGSGKEPDEAAIKKITFEIQQLQNTIQTVTTVFSSIQKASHDTQLSVANKIA
jgi:hypothetical protein